MENVAKIILHRFLLDHPDHGWTKGSCSDRAQVSYHWFKPSKRIRFVIWFLATSLSFLFSLPAWVGLNPRSKKEAITTTKNTGNVLNGKVFLGSVCLLAASLQVLIRVNAERGQIGRLRYGATIYHSFSAIGSEAGSCSWSFFFACLLLHSILRSIRIMYPFPVPFIFLMSHCTWFHRSSSKPFP